MGIRMWDRPGSVDRWVEHEYRSLNAGLVARKKSLAALLAEPDPACVTREGEPWPFDRAVLERLASHCSDAEARELLLPITVHVSTELGDSCYVTDALAAEVLRRSEGFGPAFPFRDGRMYLPLSLGVDLVSRHRGAIQQVFL